MYDAELNKIECNPRRGRLPAFSFAKPANWHALAFPYPPASFDDPGYYEPAIIASTPATDAMLTIGTRPAPATGSLRESLAAWCRTEGAVVAAIRPYRTGLLATAHHSSNGVTMAMRIFFLEDGGRLYAICAMAAEPLFDSIQLLLSTMAESFELASPAGSTMPIDAIPDSAFHSTLGLTFPVPSGWAAANDGASAVLSQTQSGVQIRVTRSAYDPAILEKLHHTYAATDPQADVMYNHIDGVAVLALANIHLPATRAFRAYFVQPAPQEGAMYLAQVTIPGGSFQAALSAASSVLASLPRA